MNAALATRTTLTRRTARVMAPYFHLEYQPWWPLVRNTLYATMVVVVIFASLLTALGGTALLKIAAAPIGVLALLVIWMLPDVEQVRGVARAADPPYLKLLLAFLLGLVMWPGYIAIVLPGLPWLTPPRVVLAFLLVSVVIHYAMHRESRERAVAVFSHEKIPVRLYLTYVAINILVLPLAPSPGATIGFFSLLLIMSVSAVLAAAPFLTKQVYIERITTTLILGTIFSMLVAVVENYMQSPPWAQHIPSFMQIDQGFLQNILSPQARMGDSRYRIRSTFPIVLYYTQYLSLVMPLLLYAMWRMTGRKRIVGLLLLPLVLHTVWFCNARTAMLSLIIPLFGFGAMAAIRVFVAQKKGDSLKTGIQLAVVLLMVGMLGGVLATSHRAQMYTFGGQQHNASNDARDRQWANAWKQLRKNPVGVGAGNSVNKVGIAVPGRDNLIIDSLFINLLVDTGYLGFICFFGSMMTSAYIGIRCFFRAANHFEELAGGMALGLISYVTACAVVSTTDNLYITFLLCGMILGIARLQDQRRAEEARLARLPDNQGAVTTSRRQ